MTSGFGPNGAHPPQPEWFADHAVQAQRGREGSTLEFYREALRLRHELQGAEELYWPELVQAGIVDFLRPGGWHCLTNFRQDSVPLPEGEVLLASAELPGDGTVAVSTTVWFRH